MFLFCLIFEIIWLNRCIILQGVEAVVRRCSIEKVLWEISQNSQEKHLCQSLFFNKKETLTQVFSCEFYEISENTFSTEHLQTTAFLNAWSLRNLKHQYMIKSSHGRCLFFYKIMYPFLLFFEIYSNIDIKRNNTEDTTKTCPCFSFLETQGILNTG